ncbi:hypothetical protein PV10_08498 [Exophiala mesophila]|uniref:Uncharacterized protein n=1 Tax=Exophiala mesophila TaxID=212818 RepID=A0A0D1WJ04_EXOME|nr:uncharacterized protein PV10_08498 [Exophiala mesophila]KIV88865.1 hypothetical protein PV10_08498 [Exophiala mesophila]
MHQSAFHHDLEKQPLIASTDTDDHLTLRTQSEKHEDAHSSRFSIYTTLAYFHILLVVLPPLISLILLYSGIVNKQTVAGRIAIGTLSGILVYGGAFLIQDIDEQLIPDPKYRRLARLTAGIIGAYYFGSLNAAIMSLIYGK